MAESVVSRRSFPKRWRSLHEFGRALLGTAPLDRVRIIREGVPAKLVLMVARDTGLSKDRLYSMTGLARATVDRKVAEGGRLSQSESERLVGFAELVGDIERIVRESGNSEGFNAAHWAAEWLERPHPALGGRKPGDLMDVADGRMLVRDLIAKQQSGAYA